MIFDYLKNPTSIVTMEGSFAEKAKELIFVYLYCILICIAASVIKSSTNFLIENFAHFSFDNLIDRIQKQESNERSFLFFIISAPILEELIFRLPLVINRRNLFISLVCLYFLFAVQLDKFSFLEVVKYFVFIIISYLVTFHVIRSKHLTFSTKQFNFYFYTNAFFFGALHITNFILYVPQQLWFFSIVFTFNQMIAGVFLGYARLRLGLLWSMALHALINLLPALIYYLR